MRKINCLSLCDGISTAQVAMALAGIEYNYYVASEVDRHAIKTTQHNYPGTIQVGNIYNLDVAKIPFRIDLIFMGFPCQSFSLVGKQGKFEDPRGQIFWQGIRIYKAVRKLNPDVKFLFENVRMDKASESVISTILGVDSIKIDSALVCAQTRKRNYWCNFGPIEQPEDRGIFLCDILQDNVSAKYNLSDAVLQRINKDEVLKRLLELKLQREKSYAVMSSHNRQTEIDFAYRGKGTLVQVNPAKEFGNMPQQQNRVYDSVGDLPTLTSSKSDRVNVVAKINNSQDGKVFAITGKSQCLSAGDNNVPKVAMGIVNNHNTFREVPNGKCLNLDANYHKGIDNHGQRTVVINTKGNPKRSQDKAACFTAGAHSGGHHSDMDVLVQAHPETIDDLVIRRLTEVEVCRLQSLPDNYFYGKSGKLIIAPTNVYKAVGNGWQADTIAHILSYLK